ncbi:uncharacterized protein [Amphiura filiformis]|uniref:uncharacterized protein n=1 Tax=Amphiura filiformis TaxID=82378 RepID=UPI003B214A90
MKLALYSKDERKALQDLRKDQSIRILPADKGRLCVILDTTEYHQKCEALLGDTNTYKKLGKRDPTSRYKKNLVSVLQDIENEGAINRVEYRKLYPTAENSPKFYGLPKVHKLNTPLRPIVSCIGSITYNCFKLVADILSPLVGKTKHHISNSQQFVELIQDQRVEEDEELRSYDVSALFTSVPVDKALRIVRSRLEQDSALGDRTELTPDQIVRLCETCLKQYFIYNGDYYEQLHGAAMGLPLSPILCDIYMEDLEQRAIATAPHPPRWWFRYVDDTHCKLKKCHSQEFTDHLNSLDKDIKFTTEGEENDSLAFLDTLTVIQPDRSIKVTIYRKSTHTDQYLNFSSNHPIDHKLGVIRTLYHRADTVVTNLQDREDEKTHVNNALVKCGYPKWALDKATEPKTHKTRDVGDKRPNKGHVVLPISKALLKPLEGLLATTVLAFSSNRPAHLDKSSCHPRTRQIRRTLQVRLPATTRQHDSFILTLCLLSCNAVNCGASMMDLLPQAQFLVYSNEAVFNG